MYYNARWYDSSLAHFAQADNIDVKVGDTQSLDRFAYVSYNPIKNTDPTGHCDVNGVWFPDDSPECGGSATSTATATPTPTITSTETPQPAPVQVPLATTPPPPALEYTCGLGSSYLIDYRYHIIFDPSIPLDNSTFAPDGANMEVQDVQLPGYAIHGSPSVALGLGTIQLNLGLPIRTFGIYNTGSASYKEETIVTGGPQIVGSILKPASASLYFPSGSIGSFSWNAISWP
jgi:hypothetical protein